MNYIVFHTDNYDTGKRYADLLNILTKDNILEIADKVEVKMSRSHSKTEVIKELSGYVLSHAEFILSLLNPHEIKLVHELIKAGSNNTVKRKHLKHFTKLKVYLLVVVKVINKNSDLFAMPDEIRLAFEPYIEAFVEKANIELTKERDSKIRSLSLTDDVRKAFYDADLTMKDMLHYWFINSFIENTEHYFKDEMLIDDFVMAYNLYFRDHKISVEELTEDLVFVLKRWSKESPSYYHTAAKSIIAWSKEPLLTLNPSLKDDIDKSWPIGEYSHKDLYIILNPIINRIAAMINIDKLYIESAVNCIYLLWRLGEEKRNHEDWFNTYWEGNSHESYLLDLCLENISAILTYLHSRDLLPEHISNEIIARLECLQMHYELYDEACSVYYEMFEGYEYANSDSQGKELILPSYYIDMSQDVK